MCLRLAVAIALVASFVGATSRASLGAPVPVRFTEAAAHGFVVLRSAADGAHVADGELVQAPRGRRIESRLTFRFDDGSFWEETVTFTQRRVFRLMAYRLAQRGPAFPDESEVWFDRDRGRYRARVGTDSDEGTIELPEDLHNGMTGTVLRNLRPGQSATGHVLALTPKPYLLATELRPDGSDRYRVGTSTGTATRYVMHAELRGVQGVVASVLGKEPADVRFWIASAGVPTFVKFEGAMFLNGPRWRIELGAPRWAAR